MTGVVVDLAGWVGAVALLGAWPSAALNAVWLVVGLVALTRVRPGRVPPPER